MTKKIPNIILFIKIYSLVLSIFFIFRFILFLTGTHYIKNIYSLDVLKAFVMGIRFDIVVSSYVLILPFFVFTIFLYFKKQNKYIKSTFFYFIFILFSLYFFISAADIPYFIQFFQRFSVTALEWLNTPSFIFKMIIQEPTYWLYIFLFLGINIAFYFFLKKIFNQEKLFLKPQNIFINIFASVLFLILMFIGIRGRVDEKSPIRVGTAYFCSNAFLNQLGLNPNFTFLSSWFEKKNYVNLMDEDEAIYNIRQSLIPNNTYTYNKNINLNPIARHIYFEEINSDSSCAWTSFDTNTNDKSHNKNIINKYNIVLIIMESMSAEKMARHGNSNNLTPFLDSLSSASYYFENCYTTGMHTFNGIAGTLFSAPALFRQHILKSSPIGKYSGVSTILKKNNYETIYFTTHDGQFDNIEGFLRHNDFNQVISASDYPKEESKTTLGVPDDYMFRFSIPILNKISKTKKPFLSVFLTSGDHAPYYIPEYFKPRSTGIKKQIVEYADYSLNKFITLAKKQEWFNNTIFVFVADHGANLSSSYDIPLSYFHTPLIFYAPEILKKPVTFNKLASQIDIYPTIMGLLKIPYINETLGIDLFRENREFAVLNADDKYGVISNNWFLIVNNTIDAQNNSNSNSNIGNNNNNNNNNNNSNYNIKINNFSLYKHKNKDKTNYALQFPDTASRMKTYAESYMQTFQCIINSKR